MTMARRAIVTSVSNVNQGPQEFRKEGRPRNWGLFGLLLSLPTLAGWILSVFFWVSSVQSFLLAAGSLLGTAGFLMCLYAGIRCSGGKWLALFGLVLNAASCVNLCALIWVVAAVSLGTSGKPKLNFTVSKETTYITEPLRPDGYPDYLAALNDRYGKHVTPDNNAAVLAWRAIGPKAIEKDVQGEFFRLLGMDPLPADGKYFMEWNDYTEELLEKECPVVLFDNAAQKRKDERKQQLSDQFRRVGIAPWSAASLPAVADWLKKNEMPLALLVAANKRPRFFSPLVSNKEPPVLNSVTCADPATIRIAGAALCVRGMLRLNDGNASGAREDLLACRRLARLLAQQPFVTRSLWARSLERQAAAGLLALFHYGPRDIEEAKSLDRQIQQMPDLPDLVQLAVEETRYIYPDSLGMVIRGIERSKDPVGWLVDRAIVDPVLTDWDGAFTLGNAWCDRMAEAAAKADRTERIAVVRDIEKECEAMNKRAQSIKPLPWQFLKSPRGAWGRLWGERLLLMSSRPLSDILEVRDDTTTRGQLLRLASTINVYRAEHGAYPKCLADLAPKYVATLPVDVFHGTAFQYRKQADGYVLYSVGPNGRDDGGRNRREMRDESEALRGCDDITLIVPPKENP